MTDQIQDVESLASVLLTRKRTPGFVPEDVKAMHAAHRKFLEETFDRSGWPTVGQTLSQHTFVGADSAPVSIDDLVVDGPAVLVFYRGEWCPYCNITLRYYEANLVPELTRLGATLAAISPQLPDGSLTTLEKNELSFAVLSDVGNAFARTLGIVFEVPEGPRNYARSIGTNWNVTNGDDSWELPMAASIVIDRNRVVRFVDIRPDYSTRTEPSDILDALRSIDAPRANPA